MKNGKFTARALDDRLGVYIIMEAIKRAKELGCKVGVYGASTTGEETTKLSGQVHGLIRHLRLLWM